MLDDVGLNVAEGGVGGQIDLKHSCRCAIWVRVHCGLNPDHFRMSRLSPVGCYFLYLSVHSIRFPLRCVRLLVSLNERFYFIIIIFIFIFY